MDSKKTKHLPDIDKYLKNFRLKSQADASSSPKQKIKVEFIKIDGKKYPKYINEYWTSKQRQACSIHEVAYRACFKAQLPRFFIDLLTQPNDTVFDPFSGRGTTVIEAALMGRKIISNDINPLNKILSKPRLNIPTIDELESRLNEIPSSTKKKSNIDLSMFYHKKTLTEILSLRDYLIKRKANKKEDFIDEWIRMVTTNRLTGHSSGFFSVYTLPPNQAVSPDSQIKINKKRKQKPPYRNIKKLILKKSKSLLKDITSEQIKQLHIISKSAKFITRDASQTESVKSNSVQLTVTSPPFLNIVQYADDNWLRCWFNNININEVEKNITTPKSLDQWCNIMAQVFKELFRVTNNNGWVAFEVGEIRSGKINLDEHVVPLGINAGFKCKGVVINQQSFTKTSNIWGIDNNSKGTNSNRIVLFQK
ncbi:MAG: site-specific DNA-methyltransferase [candidate division Zixibacteria bacterium]|nr:site-specific DNA-methyltransferase [candidate division Zixibacteria bacterium]